MIRSVIPFARSSSRSPSRRSPPLPEVALFAFFSNRLGCLGSLVVSVIGTLLLLAVLNLLFQT